MMNYIKIFKNNNFQKIAIRKCTISIGSVFPTGILVDIINSTGNNQSCTTNDAQDLGEILKSHNKAVVFALPGALTPTCAAKHLPGFINHAEILRAKGVDGIFCVSVNDKFVMKAWGEMTPNFNKSGIQLIADGNGEYSKAVGLLKDFSGYRMGFRSARYAAIVEKGVLKQLFIDDKALEKSAAENVLSHI